MGFPTSVLSGLVSHASQRHLVHSSIKKLQTIDMFAISLLVNVFHPWLCGGICFLHTVNSIRSKCNSELRNWMKILYRSESITLLQTYVTTPILTYLPWIIISSPMVLSTFHMWVVPKFISQTQKASEFPDVDLPTRQLLTDITDVTMLYYIITLFTTPTCSFLYQ